MHTVLSIVITVLIFGVIIFIHEFGHFLAARAVGVTVNEFSIGMGPAIFQKQGKRTKYTLRALPIGGYCAMEGEEEDSEDENSFRNKSVPKRILICIAGPVMNLLLGLLITIGALIGSKYYSSTTVAVFKEDAISMESGLQVGDRIVKMNHLSILSDQDIVLEALRDDDGAIDMVVVRDGERVTLPQVQFAVQGEGEERSLYLDFKVLAVDAGVPSCLSYATRRTISLVRSTWISIGDLITGRAGFSELSGPVGVGQAVGEAAKNGARSLVSLAAFLSISIGMFNLFPFPALDGGRVLFLLIEAVRRKPVSAKVEGIVNLAGLLCLFALMIAVTFKDIWNLF